MKKVFVLAIALLAVGLTVVQAQDLPPRVQELQREAEQLAAKLQRGQGTQADFQRIEDISVEMIMLMMPGMSRADALAMVRQAATMGYQEDAQSAEARRMIEEQERRQQEQARLSRQLEEQERARQAQQQREEEQRRMYLGNTRGWPTVAMFRAKYEKFASLKQPAGTNASYDYEDGSLYSVYLSGGNTNTVIQDLVRQIEAATGQKMTRVDDTHYKLVPEQSRNSVLEFTIHITLYDGVVMLAAGMET
jgi:hypothetical protein